MAIVSATVFKAQVAAMATALTTAYSDSGATKVADAISNPKHPLRQPMKLMNFNATTGVWTSNDALIDGIYAGAVSTLGARGRQDRKMTAPVLVAAVTTAVVADASPTQITLTLNKPANNISGLSLTLGGVRLGYGNISFNGNVVTINLRQAIVNGNVVVIAFGEAQMADLSSLTMTAQAVTNNVT